MRMSESQKQACMKGLREAEAKLNKMGFYRVCAVLADDGSSGIHYSNGKGQKFKVNFDLSQERIVVKAIAA